MVTTNRLFQDFISFTIDTDPGAAGLSLSGPGLTDLLVVASPDFIALTIDPQEVDGDSEIIWVSVHTSAATTATIIRGQEGTTGRAHNIGTIVKASVTQDSLDEFLREKAFGGVAAEVPVHDHSAAAEAGLLVFAGWQLTKSVDQDDTGTHDVTWDVEDIDTNGFHTGSNADITVPSGLGGTYLVKAALRSTAHSLLMPMAESTDNYVDVAVDSLDDIISELGLSHVEFLKINVEGAELEVLKGAERVLKMPGAKLVISTHTLSDGVSTFPGVVSYLTSRGFEIHTKGKQLVYASLGTINQ